MKFFFLAISILICSGLITTPGWCVQGETPRVVVSIKPIHALVAGVMQGVAEPLLLIKGGGSPHGYVLRPSEARDLSSASLIVWVGHPLEGFLEKPLKTLGRNAQQLELTDVLAAELLPLRASGSWEVHAGDHAVQHDADLGLNPHLWLSPLLAKRIVDTTLAALIELDPAHRLRYRENASRLQERLDQLHRELTLKLEPVKDVPYVVFHDAYQYFETLYKLNAVGSITINPERRPGVKRILQMREKIATLKARCVFSEPQFEPKLVATIIEGTGAGSGVLDPLGSELPAGPENYFQLMDGLAKSLLAGLR